MTSGIIRERYASLKTKDDNSETNRYRTSKCRSKHISDTKVNNSPTEQAKVKWNDQGGEQDSDKVELMEEMISTSMSTHTPHKYISKSGDPRASRGILKNAEEISNHRPATVGSNREANNMIYPRWQSMENQKYNLKINNLIHSDTIKAGSVIKEDPIKGSRQRSGKDNRETKLPSLNFESDDRRRIKRHWVGIKTALKDRVLETGDVYTYFNPMGVKRTSEVVSSSSIDNDKYAVPSSRRTKMSPNNVVDSGFNTDSSEDTPCQKYLSISDSEECDTDLEIDKDFGKGSSGKDIPPYLPDIIPSSDINIGKTVYIRECEKWKTSPQSHVLNSLPERSMTLRNRSLGANAVPPICAALRDNLRVERLSLDGIDITDDGIQHVAEMLIDNISITHLNVANNSLGVRGAQVLGHVLVVTGNITHLNISGNKLDENSSWYLTSGIGSNESITHLDISYNELGEQTGVLLGAALARNSKLCNLNMGWNKVCGKGAVAIFRALMINSTLEVLNISWNGIGYEGAVALSKCVKRNVGLRDLDVSNNRLNWRCAFLLAEGLRSNFTLAKLRIGHNPLTTTGSMDILEAVATKESAITFLDFTEIPVLGAADLLAATVSRRRPFQFLHGGIVPTHDKIGQRLGRELNPMLRIIEYLRLLGLRPLELMKSFDKTSSFELPRKDFVDQIKKIGVKLHSYEIDALANSISGKGYNKNVINYRKLSLAVREVVEAERERKIREREEWLQIKSYHESILKKGTLDEYISSSGSTKLIEPMDSLKTKSFQTIAPSGTTRNSTGSKPGSADSSKLLQFSLCSPLVLSKSVLGPDKPKNKRKSGRRK